VGRHVAWGTGGRTDEFVRFADARTVLLAWPDAGEVARHPVSRLNQQRMQHNFEILSAAADTTFSREWTAASFPRHERRREGDWVMQVASASYLNFVVANGVVVLPDYLPHGTPRAVQKRVQADVEQAFPGRVVRWVDAVGANWVGGGAHCASLSEPRV